MGNVRPTIPGIPLTAHELNLTEQKSLRLVGCGSLSMFQGLAGRRGGSRKVRQQIGPPLADADVGGLGAEPRDGGLDRPKPAQLDRLDQRERVGSGGDGERQQQGEHHGVVPRSGSAGAGAATMSDDDEDEADVEETQDANA